MGNFVYGIALTACSGFGMVSKIVCFAHPAVVAVLGRQGIGFRRWLAVSMLFVVCCTSRLRRNYYSLKNADSLMKIISL